MKYGEILNRGKQGEQALSYFRPTFWVFWVGVGHNRTEILQIRLLLIIGSGQFSGDGFFSAKGRIVQVYGAIGTRPFNIGPVVPLKNKQITHKLVKVK